MNRNIGYFRWHTGNDKTKDIVKGVDSALECKTKGKECVQNLDKILAGKSLKELEETNDTISDKSSETSECVDEEKEWTSNETVCHKKSAMQQVAELERGTGNRN